MKTIQRIAVALVAILLAGGLFAAPAQAEDGPTPSIEYPLYRPAANTTGDALVQIEAPAQAYGLRRWAKALDARIDGLTIFTTGTCAARPEAVCVRYVFGVYTPEQQAQIAGRDTPWAGLTTFTGLDERTIYLRTDTWGKRATVAHELGHALGLGHHTSHGLMSLYWGTTVISDDELITLQEWFAVPRFRA